MITVEVNNQHPTRAVSAERLRRAVFAVLSGEGVSAANVSIAVVDDATSHALNARYLQHDYPTDVLSFPLDERPGLLEGEVVVSADQAERVSAEYGWSADDELLLYLVHGLLHLTGYDDHSEAERRQMRAKEQQYLRELGLQPRGDG